MCISNEAKIKEEEKLFYFNHHALNFLNSQFLSKKIDKARGFVDLIRNNCIKYKTTTIRGFVIHKIFQLCGLNATN